MKTILAGFATVLMAVYLYAAETGFSRQGGVAIPVNQWTLLSSNAKYFPRYVGWETSEYVPYLEAHAGWFMYREISSEINHTWAAYDFAENLWKILDYGSHYDDEHLVDGGHPVQGVSVDPVMNTAFGASSNSGGSGGPQQRLTAFFDFTSQTGRMMIPTNSPAQSSGINYSNLLMAGKFDPVNRKLIIHGGTSFQGTSEYSVVTNSWANGIACTASAANCPDPSLTGAVMAYGKRTKKMYQFGGLHGAPAVFENTLFTYDATVSPASSRWVKLSPTGGPPTARWYAAMSYIDSTNELFLYGGCTDVVPCSSVGTRMYDAWLYNIDANTWTQLSPAVQAPTVNGGIFNRMSYDPIYDIILLFLVNDLNANATEVWGYRPPGHSGPKAGFRSVPRVYPPGSISRNSDSWGDHPAASTDGTSLFTFWTETGGPTDNTASRNLMPYARKWTTGIGQNLGSAYNSMANGPSSSSTEGNNVCTGVVGGTLWAAWNETDNVGLPTGLGIDQLMAKSWNGSTWVGGLVTPIVTNISYGQCSIADVGGVPHIMYRQFNSTGGVPSVYAIVKKFVSGSWTQVGTGVLNRDESGPIKSRAVSVSLVSDGTNPVAAWTEYTMADAGNPGITMSPPKVYVSRWNGSAWVNQGGAANVDTTNGRAQAVSLEWFNSQPTVAFSERASAIAIAQLRVRTWNGSAWSNLGSTPLNRNTSNSWTYRPECKKDGSNLYCAWDESGAHENSTLEPNWTTAGDLLNAIYPGYAGFSYRPQIFVSMWDGTIWNKLGGSLNIDPAWGSAKHPSLAILGGFPNVVWGEVEPGLLRRIYGRAWNGSDWVPLSLTNSLVVTTSSPMPADTVNVAYSQTLQAFGGTPPYTWAITPALPAGLSLNSSTGAITGTPTVPGTVTFTATVTDSASATYPQVLSLTINNNPSVSTSSLAGGTTGAAYSQPLTNSGGTSPFTWTITPGTLPVGLTLSGPTITGTPHTAGTSNFTVKVTDSLGANASKALSIVVSSNLSVTTSSLPGGTAGAAYSQNLSASGGFGAYTWTVASGSLPAGVSLTGATISGTPSASGTSTFTVRATDAGGNTAVSGSLSITISGILITTPTPLSQGTIGTAYSVTLTPSGGTPAYTWTISAGALPAGLTLGSATGVITGVPSGSAGTASFTVTVTDSLSASIGKAFTLTTNAAPAVTTNTPMPGGTVGTPYNQTLTETGGTLPLAWSITGGALPPGLTLNASTGAITGTPTVAGPYTFTASVSDGNSAFNGKSLSITVIAGGPVSPNPRMIGTKGVDTTVR